MKNNRIWAVLILVLVLLLVGSSGVIANQSSNSAVVIDQSPRIAIVSAFGAELDAFISQAKI